ncbi:membrane protein [Azospira sp. I13]|uniref:DUF3619 family protein n=1 Tax=Azospira sp. I13 TaxID=1765050 RepID=UPI000D458D5B|nr:DUF3619 family protein [Azospira sp. I13]GBG01007.1 membrane protein [Azospira sp. I13]
MNEQHFAYQVRRHLNQGTMALSPSVMDRLAAARTQALAHQRMPSHVPVLAGLGVHFHMDNLRPRHFLAALALAIGLSSGMFWQAQEQVAELEEVDSALLADDLPLDAYTDQGFAAWLDENPDE